MSHYWGSGKHPNADEFKSACEIYVAIIVGSMPAFASFFKGQMPGATFLAGMNSLILRTRHGASRVRLSRWTSKDFHSSESSVISNRNPRDRGYLELHDTRPGENGSGPTRTNISGEGIVLRDVEEGVVRKTVTVQRSTQEPPVTRVSG